MNENSIHSENILLALEEAKKTRLDVPVGCIITHAGEIIAKSCNEKELKYDVSAHAEMIAIRKASQKMGRWRLDDVSIYITLEPCPMCASAILYSRIPNIYFGAYDPLYGALGSAINMRKFINYKPHIIGGIEEEKCSAILKDFFQAKR